MFRFCLQFKTLCCSWSPLSPESFKQKLTKRLSQRQWLNHCYSLKWFPWLIHDTNKLKAIVTKPYRSTSPLASNFLLFHSPRLFFVSFPLRHKITQPSPSPRFSNFLRLVPSISLLHTPAHTNSHLCWGGVLYFINSRLHAKIHYASLLFSSTQACQLTCGTNFSPPSFHPSSPTPANKYV